MDVLAVGLQDSIKQTLGITLLENGIAMHSAHNLGDFNTSLQRDKPSVVIFDPDIETNKFAGADVFALMRRLQQSDATFNLICLSGQTQPEKVHELVEIGVKGFVSKTHREDRIADQIYERILSLNNEFNDKRQHVRVNPSPNDELGFNFPIPGSDKVIRGTILNISLGGAMLQAYGVIPPYALEVGQSVENMQLSLNHRLTLTGINIVVLRDTYLGVRFINQREGFRNMLSHYIFEKLLGQ